MTVAKTMFLVHFLIETLCVSIVTLPTLRGKSAVFPLADGAGVRFPSEAGQARPPELLPFSMAFRSTCVFWLPAIFFIDIGKKSDTLVKKITMF